MIAKQVLLINLARLPKGKWLSAWHMGEEPKNPAASVSGRVFLCALDRIRTYGLLLRRQTLYPLSYEGISRILPLPVGRPRA